jgi:hypothetical protein
MSDIQSEPVSIKTYEEFCEMQNIDSDLYGWTAETECEYFNSEYGIDIDPKKLCFDVNYVTCTSDGNVYDHNKFIDKNFEALMKESAVMTEIFREQLEHVRWGTAYFRNSIMEFTYSEDYSHYGYDFKSGIFAGLSVDEMFEAEPIGNVQNWYQCIEDIINDYHQQIIKTLRAEEDYRTSEEAYQEWLANENY